MKLGLPPGAIWISQPELRMPASFDDRAAATTSPTAA
jgi:hypothetical protein